MGRVDHPHLIRVNHFTRNGVYLRDVKRWLADLRGKEMPEGFAWSYKRRYKTGYVWQDLLDEDLITPISDNEYVLKGSEITSSPFDSPPKSFAEKRSCLFKDEVEPPNSKQEASFQLHQQIYPKNNIDIQTKVSSEMSQESQRSTLTDGFDDAKCLLFERIEVLHECELGGKPHDCVNVKQGLTGERTVKRLRLSKALTVPENTSVQEACRRMAARRVDALLLTDSNALLCGILTDKVGNTAAASNEAATNMMQKFWDSAMALSPNDDDDESQRMDSRF
ncbi:hypothetical protein EV2_008833 [Malus domestica]